MHIGLILSLILLSISFFVLIIKNKNFFYKLYPSYNPVQKIHSEYVPPLGGVIIFFMFFIYLILKKLFITIENSFFLNSYIVYPSIAIIFVGIYEDIFGKASVGFRFFTILISSLLYILFTPSLPHINLPIIGDLINNNYLIKILFFTFGLTALTNGTNMIDGMNGLAGITILCILITISMYLYLNNKFIFLNYDILVLSIFLFIFLLFNFPFGKIFLGDAGAYWLGWILGVIVIYIFSFKGFNTWIAVVILFYPLMEVFFSTIRKLLKGKSPLKPDEYHLHLKIYKQLKGPTKRDIAFNSFTTLCLMPFWSFPLLSIMWVHYYSHIAIFFIFFMSVLYLIYYKLVPKNI